MSMDPDTARMMLQYQALAGRGQPQQAQGPASGFAAGGTQLLQALMMAKKIKALRDAQNGGPQPSVGAALQQGAAAPAPGPFPGPGNYDPSQAAANAAGVS